jgi:serine protease AprX
MPQYFVRFPSETMRPAAMLMFDADPERFRAFRSQAHDQILIADISEEQRFAAEKNGAKVYEDIQFYPTPVQPDLFHLHGRSWAYWEVATAHPSALATLAPSAAAQWHTKTLTDVLNHINAPKAWQKKARGQGVTIGIVDTGVCSTMLEFPQRKRSEHSKSFAYAAGPWADNVGHGSMCASIATGTTAAGGKYNGVAPDATLLSARSNFLATDIYKLYDWVLDKKRTGLIAGPVVMSNSYGLYTCSAPAGLPSDHPYRQILVDAVSNGIVVVYAAGNNHAGLVCNNDPTKCSPNTIWSVNSMDEVLSVGTVDSDNRMDSGLHANSSRGPGQWAAKHKKPDCVAPTYGEVVWGNGYRVMEWWGTSGACPQVAGLAALMLSVDRSLRPAQVGEIIRKTCCDIRLPVVCGGAGLIDCETAIARLMLKKHTAKKSKTKQQKRRQ